MSILFLKQQIHSILGWSEKYTKTDMVYLAKGSFWMMTRQVMVSLIAFGMAIAFANLIPKETYGAYKYALSVSLLLATATLSGINTSLTRSVANGFDGSLIPALYARIKWGILGSAVGLSVVAYYGLQGNTTLVLVFAVVVVFLPFKSSFSVYQAYWQGKQQFDRFTKLSILQEVFSAGAILVTLFLTQDLFLLIFMYFCAQTAVSGVLYLYTLRRRTNDHVDGQMISYGKHVSMAGILFAISNNSLDIILWHFIGPTAVAIFAFANRPPQELRRVFTEAFPIALPKFSQSSKEEIKQTLPMKVVKLYLILIPSVILYILIAPSIFQLLFPQYLEAAFYSQVLSLSILFAPLSLFGIVFQALGRTRELYITSTFSTVVLIPALMLGAWLSGLIGLIIAWFIVQIIGACVVFYLFKRM
jgi:O-antigen/teichoic acid export membrane protein